MRNKLASSSLVRGAVVHSTHRASLQHRAPLPMKLSAAFVSLFFLSPVLCPGQAIPGKPAVPPIVKPAKPVLPRDSIDSLSDADMARILPLLKENYIGADKITEKEIARATLQGLIDRLAPGAAILQGPSAVLPTEPSPFRSELIDEKIAYVRLGALQPANLTELDTTLQNLSTKGIGALVLDLRQ